MGWEFTAPDLFDRLKAADTAALDTVPFGIIAMSADGLVTGYNRAESLLSGLAPASVLGRHFFSGVGLCTSNAVVAGRFAAEPALDSIIDYVFAFAMQPVPVRLRLLRQPRGQRMYLVVARR